MTPTREQLRLFEVAQVVRLRRPSLLEGRPRGVMVRRWNGRRYLVNEGDENPLRVFGWYYGYPSCCIEALVAGRSSVLWLDSEKRLHPTSGHVLCASCASGPLAPLPPRPAERFAFASVHPETGWLVIQQPSSYTPVSVPRVRSQARANGIR